MKKYIVKAIKNRIEEMHDKWALNWLALKEQEELDTPEAKKNVESCKFNMTKAEEKITWLKKLQKTQE